MGTKNRGRRWLIPWSARVVSAGGSLSRLRWWALESNLILFCFHTHSYAAAGRKGGGEEGRGSGSWCNAVQVRRDEMAGDFQFV